MTPKKHNGFMRGFSVFVCGSCGKQSRYTGEQALGSELCPKCWEEAGLENEHSDDGHAEFNPDCPTCRAEADEKVTAAETGNQ